MVRIRSLKIQVFILVLLFLLPAKLLAQVNENEEEAAVKQDKTIPVDIPYFDEAPEIDGNPNEEIWKRAAQFRDFIQTEPGELTPPSKQTIAYMGYDSENLYIAFYCFDDPDKISYNVAKRDSVGDLDYVGIFLDTFDDQRRAYILQFNPLGIQADGIKNEGERRSDFSLDIIMESKGLIQKDGWSVEVKIPFSSLRYKAGKGVYWGIDIWRRINRFNSEIDGWQPVRQGIPELQQLGRITGLNEIRSKRSIEITPSVSFNNIGTRVGDTTLPPDFSRIETENNFDAGASIKFQITPNVTLDAAFNPDFAEVEADAPVVTANQRFPIFFAEKRPFFLEGSDYFRTGLQVINTRNIANPDVALKLTGKVGRNTFGILGAVDDFPEDELKGYVGAGRYKRDVGENSGIGMFFTEYHLGADKHNHLLGGDGNFQINQSNVVAFSFAGTYSKDYFYNPDTDESEYRSGTGAIYKFIFDNTQKNTGLFLNFEGKTDDYRAAVGFTRRTSYHGLNIGGRIQNDSNPENRLIRWTLRPGGGIHFDDDGRLQDASVRQRFGFLFQNQVQMDFTFGASHDRLYEDEFGPRRNATQDGAFFGLPERRATSFRGEFGAQKRFNSKLEIDGEIGFTKNRFDLDFGAGEKYPRVSPAALAGEDQIDPGPGFFFRYEVGVDYQPTEPLKLNLYYSRRRLRRNDTGLIAFDASIVSGRAIYQFTRFIFARTRWDYETSRGGLNGQVLFGWSPSPGTAFYAGYNDNSFYQGYNDYTSSFDTGFRQDGRSFFLRFSYLFRKEF